MTNSSEPDHAVRDLVAQADRQRRARAVALRLRQLAPGAAALALGVGLAGRFLLGWSPWIGVATLAASAVGLAAYALLQSRTRPTTDAIASAVDADADLAGELRSAHWFEAQTARDAWADFHLDRAARRATGVNWSELYPRVRSARPWIATGVLSVLAVGLAVKMPERRAQPIAAVETFDVADLGPGLSPEMMQKLAALMAQLDQAIADKDPNAKQLPLADLKDLMAKLDPAMQKKLADMLEKRAALGADKKNAEPAPGADQRADRAENATAGLPEDAKWAQDNEAARAAQAGDDKKPGQNSSAAASKAGDKATGAPQGQPPADAPPQASAALMRESATQQNGKLMMGGGGPMGGDSRPGSGAGNDATKGAAEALLVAKALRKELVEASADALGENVDKEDLRRKTEQGTSSLGFTHAAPPRAFEPSRAVAPPPVPEARRPLLFNYFIRKK